MYCGTSQATASEPSDSADLARHTKGGEIRTTLQFWAHLRVHRLSHLIQPIRLGPIIRNTINVLWHRSRGTASEPSNSSDPVWGPQ
jgi:hypothetical protein